jgi:hypothetical protein
MPAPTRTRAEGAVSPVARLAASAAGETAQQVRARGAAKEAHRPRLPSNPRASSRIVLGGQSCSAVSVPSRLCAVLVALLLLVASAGCGSDDAERLADRARQEAEERADRLRASLEERAERLRRRIEEVLGDLERAVPRADRTSPRVQARGRTEQTTIDAFLTDIITSVDAYWTRTLRASGLREPAVRYLWIPAGDRRPTRCGVVAGDDAAFYCPADDTIYVAQRFAADLYNGVARGLPGERAGATAFHARRPPQWPVSHAGR